MSPNSLGLQVFLDKLPAAVARRATEAPRRTQRRVLTWYEDRADRTYPATDLREWAAPAARRALEAAAAAFGDSSSAEETFG